jgi:polygalacturonase/pectin methylesterase-like acyl-CoA thioesterase
MSDNNFNIREVNFGSLIAFGLVAILTPPILCRAENVTVGWDQVPAILTRIQAPQFPARDFAIIDFGAKADGVMDCTEAIEKAITACNAAGGGRVVASGGVFLTGAIHLKSNVNLHIAEGATLKFSPDPAKYLPVVLARYEGTECMNYSPLFYALEQENIAVTGKGTLDGSASRETWWGFVPKKGEDSGHGSAGTRELIEMANNNVPVDKRIFGDKGSLRPNFIVIYRCKNILIADVHIVNSPMWEIHPVLCANVTVRGLEIHSHGPNNDGCDPESSRDVLIENCSFDTGDDCIAIKSGKDVDGRRVNVPSENIIIRKCVMKDGHGGIVLGSENSGGIRNVFAENCTMDSPNLDRALRLKTNASRGGFIENVYMRRCDLGQVAHSILTIDLVYGHVTSGPFKPIVRNVFVENVTSKKSPRVLSIVGIADSAIENIRIAGCTFRGVEGADILSSAGEISYKNVTIEPSGKHRAKAATDGEFVALSTRAPNLTDFDAVVDADGSGTHRDLRSAIAAAPDRREKPYRILLKPGTYQGQLLVAKEKRHIHLIAQEVEKTIITYGLNQNESPTAGGMPLYNNAVTVVLGDDFRAENITFQNTCGDRGQALALRVDGDRAVFQHCRLLGWQDTLLLNNGRQYFVECHIEGRVDFIYGAATAVFDRCEIHSKNGGHVTAASTPRDHPFGFVFLQCKLTGDPQPWVDAQGTPVNQRKDGKPQADLGRPWRPYASVTYINCEMGDHILPQGWTNWRNAANESTARYAEYNSTGPGANPTLRVKWAKQLTKDEADKLSVQFVLSGDDQWNPVK